MFIVPCALFVVFCLLCVVRRLSARVYYLVCVRVCVCCLCLIIVVRVFVCSCCSLWTVVCCVLLVDRCVLQFVSIVVACLLCGVCVARCLCSLLIGRCVECSLSRYVPGGLPVVLHSVFVVFVCVVC